MKKYKNEKASSSGPWKNYCPVVPTNLCLGLETPFSKKITKYLISDLKRSCGRKSF